ncbi:hypothetical protein N0V93_004672 [Gnomoniopsis smithogilvyi]|uniref:FAD-binding domain-containing protein n=1 Tax=Gnomoniopsis smithogilvyi TaxID=1191159 RepID=A0A9W8YT98_9PEZI|nr:hypothetical protein N0V93_004672 [Gnomoniopsis smithogilvyi]
MSQPQKIRVAITGGVLAGATLLRALIPYSHLDVHIFEAAPEFKEAGASIGISRNALAALELIGPSAVQCLERAGAFAQDAFVVKLAVGEDQGRTVAEVGKNRGWYLKSAHRPALLRELLEGTPTDCMHTSKRLDKFVRKSDGSLELHFLDGTTHDCDILIGADGVRSTVRKWVLGEDNPAAKPQNSGWWVLWWVKPHEEAKSHGVDLEDTCQHAWIGDGTYSMHSIFSRGQMVSFAICTRDDNAGDRHSRLVSAKEIRTLYSNYPPNLVKAIDEMFCDKPEQSAFYLWEHSVPASTYVSGPLCLIGDSAHATTPWQASGGAMSIEDALILSTLLGKTTAVADAIVALRVYDKIRRPRTQKVIESSRGTGFMMTGRGEDTGLQAHLLEEKLCPRWDFIHNLDMEKHQSEAIEMLEQELLG